MQGLSTRQYGPIRILFTMDDIGFGYRKLISKGLGLWVLYIFCQYLISHQRSFTLEGYGNSSADYDYVLYLRSIRGLTKQRLIKFVQTNEIGLIIPTDVKDSQLLAFHKRFLQPYVKLLVCDHPDIYDSLDNKMLLNTLARSLEVKVPEALNGNSLECMEAFKSRNPFPYYWKKVCNTNGGKGVKKISNENQLTRLKLARHREPYILQAGIEGEMYSIDCLFNKGRIISIFGKKRTSEGHETHIRNYFFPSKNQHDCAEIEVINRIAPIVTSIGERVNYSGTIDFEFIVNSSGCFLIEVNPRFSGGCYSWIHSEYLSDYLACLLGEETCRVRGPHPGTVIHQGVTIQGIYHPLQPTHLPQPTQSTQPTQPIPAQPFIRSQRSHFGRLEQQNVLSFFRKYPKLLINLSDWD